MEHNNKIKKAFWITEDMDREIDAHLKLDNCSSRSEFVMNALKFYVGYLNTKNASAFLPEALSTMLTGTLDGFAGRISSLLFKQGVDINLMAQIIAYDTDIDEGAYPVGTTPAISTQGVSQNQERHHPGGREHSSRPPDL